MSTLRHAKLLTFFLKSGLEYFCPTSMMREIKSQMSDCNQKQKTKKIESYGFSKEGKYLYTEKVIENAI